MSSVRCVHPAIPEGSCLSHYLALPVIVTLIAAVIGNVLGYTFFKDICAGMYYGSYSLPTYETRWNVNAFLLTTVVPILLMLLVNVWLIAKRLRLSPLKFLRRDLSGKANQTCGTASEFPVFPAIPDAYYFTEPLQLSDVIYWHYICKCPVCCSA